jgi:starch phosphorylase
MTPYKRPNLLFSDIERLKSISKAGGGLQIIFSGKAHPEDLKGKRMIKTILQNKRALSQDIRIAYLENYDMGIAKRMVCGVDLWLNTPLIPREASGTSGMKATLNGVLNLSILDGWWIEGYIKDITGFAIGGMESDEEKDGEDLYGKLEEISRIYYDDRKRWISMMRYALSINASFFNSRRMVQQYITDAYWD